MDAAVLEHQKDRNLPPQGVNKWEMLRELSAARLDYGLNDRDMAVLQALVSFHQKTVLGGNSDELVVYPSNKAICERLSGMPCSTMRRHLGQLVQTGMVIRRDSPNGKRYARTYDGEKVAFGFDLSPLAARFAEFCAAAEAARASQERFRRLRETVSLMRRDLAGLAAYGQDVRPDLRIWDRFSDLAILTARDLRRKLMLDDLRQLETQLSEALKDARDTLEPQDTGDMSTNPARNGQHYQNSNSDSHDLELRLKNRKAATDVPGCQTVFDHEGVADVGPEGSDDEPDVNRNLPNLPLGLVLTCCVEIQAYGDGLRHWHDLVRAADIVRPMMGISPSCWDEAKREMGPEQAAVVIAAMLEKQEDIRSPGGYLRHLSARAARGEFSCGPMIMALYRREAA